MESVGLLFASTSPAPTQRLAHRRVSYTPHGQACRLDKQTINCFSSSCVYSSHGRTEESSDRIPHDLFGMQFLSYQGRRGSYRKPQGTFRRNTDMDEHTASTANFPWVRSTLSLWHQISWPPGFITASLLCEPFLLYGAQHTLGQKTVMGNGFPSYQETYISFMDPTLPLKLFSDPTRPILTPFLVPVLFICNLH